MKWTCREYTTARNLLQLYIALKLWGYWSILLLHKSNKWREGLVNEVGKPECK